MKHIKIKLTIFAIVFNMSFAASSQAFSHNTNIKTDKISTTSAARTFGDWKETVAVATMNNQLYSIEKSGTLYWTNLKTGEKKSLGSEKFYYTRFLFSHNGMLYTIESDGGVFEIKLVRDGAYEIRTVSDAISGWKDTSALMVFNRRIYSIKDGALFRNLSLNTSAVRLGEQNFSSVKFMFSIGRMLYTLDKDGSLFEISPTDGLRTRVGNPGALKNVAALTTLDSKLYTIQNGTLFRINTKNGKSSKLTWFNSSWKSQFMFSADESLYSIETDGDLFRINPKNGDYKQILKK